jgi:uncharacterized protein YbjT (DUF2867 family)
MILVTGAGGVTGTHLIERLAQAGARTRAFVRSPAAAARARAAGAAEVHTGTLESDADVDAAMKGVAAVYHVCPNVHPGEVAIGTRVIDAARRAGAGHLVFHSVIQPQIEAMPHHWDKLIVEGHLVASGLDYTILQPCVYMQNLAFQWEAIRTRGEYAQPYRAEARLALVDVADVAAAATRVLLEPAWRNGSFELCGTEAMDRHAMASIIAEVLGRPVHAVVEPIEAWAARTRPRLGETATARLRAMFEYYDRHGLTAANTFALRGMLGRPPTDFAAYVRRLAATG